MQVLPALHTEFLYRPGTSELEVFFRCVEWLVFAVEELPEAMVLVNLNLGPLRRIEDRLGERCLGDGKRFSESGTALC